MISKLQNIILKSLFLMLSCFVFSACGEFLKGKPKKQEVIEIKNADVQCMKDIQKDFKKLIEATSTEEDIDKTFTCLNKTLDQFKSKVEGRSNPNSFTSEELFSILDKFFKDAQISKKATEDILVLKKAILGGQDDFVTKVELGLLKDYLKIVQGEVKKITPYVKMFSFKKENGPYTKEQINSGFEQLRQSLQKLLTESKMSRSGYSFEDLKQLALSLKILKEDEDKDIIQLTQNVLNLLLGEESLKTPREYEIAVNNFIDIAKIYAGTVYTDMKFEITDKNDLSKTITFADELILALEKSLQYRKHKLIPLKYLDPVISEVLKSGILPLKVTEGTFLNFYKKMIIKVFSDKKSMAIENLVGIDEIVLRNLKREMYVYVLFQGFIDSLDFGVKNQLMPEQVKAQLKIYNFGVELSKLSEKVLAQEQTFDSEMKQSVLRGLEEFRTEGTSKFSVLYRQKRMILALNQNIAPVNWNDMSSAHYAKMIARELMLGWGNVASGFDLTKSYLNEKNLVDWYDDFRPFGVEVKLFDPRSSNSGSRSFLEANLFTYAGNGDDKMDYTETMQYVSMLFSGGGEMTDIIIKDMAKAGCRLSELDAFGNPWLDEACFIKRLKFNYKWYFTNVFNFSGFISQLTDEQFTQYYYELMDISRNDAKTKGRVETADIRTFTTLVLYIEGVYGRYDVEAPAQTFNAKEVRASYPRFKSFVTQFAETAAGDKLAQWDKFYNVCSYSYTKEDFLREAFIFLVYNGRLPEVEDMNYVTCAYKGLFTFTGEVNRRTIVSTFKIIQSVLASKNVKVQTLRN